MGLTTDEEIQAHWDAHHAKYRDEAMDEDGGLFLNHDAQWLFINKVCEIIGGEDAHKRFSPNELIAMCQEMSTSHEEYSHLMAAEDAAEANEEFYQSQRLGTL